jgi:hypothetical protein
MANIFSKIFKGLTGGSNERADAGSAPYSGYRPPRVNNLRPVEDQITQILMQRSKGEGVGYDPKRRDELSQNFSIQQDRDMEDTRSDLQNRISGMGLSRNPAVYDELLGRAEREAGREKNLYENRIDIEDLERRNEERDVNTGRLQGLNTFNFGQENAAADFDLRAFAQDSANALNWENYRQSPIGTALQVAGAASKFFPGGGGGEPITMSQGNAPVQGYQQSIHTSSGPGYKKDVYGDYLNQKALQSGKNFQR